MRWGSARRRLPASEWSRAAAGGRGDGGHAADALDELAAPQVQILRRDFGIDECQQVS